MDIGLFSDFVVACRHSERTRLWLSCLLDHGRQGTRRSIGEFDQPDQARRLPGEQAYCQSGSDQKPFTIKVFYP
jgi:hypothetical protein